MVIDSPHPVDIHVGAKLRTIRLARGLSQAALAERVGVTFQQVQKYERGANRLSASRLYDFAEILQVSVPDFFDGLGLPPSPCLAWTADDYQVIAHLNAIPDPDTRLTIKRLIRQFSESLLGQTGNKTTPPKDAAA